MTGDDNNNPPPSGGQPPASDGQEARTVFSPATGFPAQAPVAPPPAPQQEPGAPPPFAAQTAAPFPSQTAAPGFGSGPIGGGEARSIQVGDVLNHIFAVQRFIARGGMGEVFEGINVNSDERVAIKGIRPHLAADPAVQAMFRKEARTLTRLSHPALVQYRVLAQEPMIGTFYIVTEYIDGQNMSDVMKDIDATPAQLRLLIKRLAEGLSAAHQLGAIHRDISPDNIMLEEGKLERAKVIDFGIAKDLDASSGTIVGDGFAGKLNYVAPEQLGDFNREIGPWTDVYSLGLTILALARKKDVDMGGSMVDAVDKRRAGPDLSPIPEELRPVLEKMLKPNPVDRARSMEEVIQLLSGPVAGGLAAAPVAPAAKPVKAPKPPKQPGESGGLAGKKGLLIGGGVAAAALIGVLALTLGGGGDEPVVSQAAPTTAAGPAAPVGDPATVAREAVASGLATVPCTWLDLVNAEAQGSSVALSFRGVAGKPAEAQGAIGKLLAAKGLQAGTIDFSDVSPIDARECAPIEAFRQIRDRSVEHLSVPQRSFEMVKLGSDAGIDAGKPGAQAVINVDLGGLSGELTLVGIEGSGEMTQFITQRSDLTNSPDIKQVPPSTYRIPLNTTHTGWSGILMLTGKGPFDAGLLNGPAGSRSGDWAQRFLQSAQQRGWKAEMVWYRTVDEVPNG